MVFSCSQAWLCCKSRSACLKSPVAPQAGIALCRAVDALAALAAQETQQAGAGRAS